MKKNVLVVAVLAALATTAQAQSSVEIFGIIDLAVTRGNGGTAANAGGKFWIAKGDEVAFVDNFKAGDEVASHIVPWKDDRANRLNPSNGLCLSAIHDRAFDQGLISLSDDWKVILSEQLRRSGEPFVESVFKPLDGRMIELPHRFVPDTAFLQRHRTAVFVDNRWARSA